MSRKYDLSEDNIVQTIAAPNLDYSPRLPKDYKPKIGLIGCGGITEQHLKAYKLDHLDVVALCDKDLEAARKRREEFYPEAQVFEDYKDLLRFEGIDVVDIALHPEPRTTAIEAALLAGKHVLTQKPFSLNLKVARCLIDLAEKN